MIRLLSLVLLAGCAEASNEDYLREKYELGARIVVNIEGCEYFVTSGYYSYSLAHKGNCTNSIHCYSDTIP